MSLLSVDQARERILSHFEPVETETLPLTNCIHRVLAADIIAADDLPLFDNSSMDGFALRAADTSNAAPASPVTLRVVADIPAGYTPKVFLAPGEAARIMTGAQMPAGADAVIPVEDTDFNTRAPGTPAPATVTLEKPINAGDNVRSRGMDVRAGHSVLEKGNLLKPQDIGLLAMLGFAEVEVYRRPRVALLSSGDELLEAGAPLESGKIRDSNSYMLAALIESAGAQVLRLGIARDTRPSVQGLIEQAASLDADLILSSAGVSVGAFDYVKDVVESNGSLNFWRVNMRPGKPLAFGEYKNIPFIGLPGNPVSAFVGFEVFVRDAIGRLGGISDGGRPNVRVRCEEEIRSDGRESYLRAVLHEKEGLYFARLTGHQGSGNLLSLVQADALLIIPAGVKCVPAGQELNAWLL
ncbi:MAG: molybdopterin molybdotransferase MoeA [Anaerolineales bacterium]|nr:molybdopterin molybdotransferase MoeA [Anaerolineales bacterium]NUQ86281.1 molybdopterin molybdotransferase MoeA [Anaerolineales bacterium]